MNKHLQKKSSWILILTFALLALNGCDISDSNKSSASEDLTDEELEVAGQIIAESLSDERDGIFASLNDAFTLPSSDNLTNNTSGKSKYESAVFVAANKKNSGNSENSYNYSYNPDSGVHLININRTVDNENILKESTAELQYIYYAADGSFIYSPRLENDRIEVIEYNGVRSGSITSPNKISTYERNDQFDIDGLTSSSGLINISGTHEGSGEYKVTRENGSTIERSYTLMVEFLDVKINNHLVSSDVSLQKGIEGALAYEMIISKNVNGNETMKTVNGTIEFNGDGTALLRFQDALDDFKVKLEEGDLLADNEFEGFVESVNVDGDGSFTLSDGETYLFNTGTEIDPDGDLTSLEDVLATLGTSIRVEAEGSFADNADGANIVQTVKFEYEDEDLEFEDFVSSVDIESNSFTLEDETVLFVNEETDFDSDGDLKSLSEVLWALDNNFNVEAEGEWIPGEEDSLIVTGVKFEYDEDDFEFEDEVQSVNPDENTFTLEAGETYVIDENTIIHEKSGLDSLQQVATVLAEGGEVDAEGEYAPQPDGTLLVKKVKFETDDFEDDDNGDDPETSEFEGEVNSANPSEKTFVASGVTYHVLQDTEFDDDIQSLGNLLGALQRGDKVYVEGDYYTDGDKNVAVELEFDVDRRRGDDDDNEEDDEDREEFDFESDVASVDLTTRTFVLEGGLTLQVNDNTEFDDGDLNTLEEVADVLANGNQVEAEGEYYIDDSDNNIVIEVEFETESDDDGDDGDDDDSEEGEFEGKIESADLDENSFKLKNGRIFILTSDSNIESDGNLLSLQEVDDALSNNENVIAEGEYSSESNGTYIVRTVKFEAKGRNDDDDDDDENEDDREEYDFEGVVSSATSTTFSLNGQTFTVNGDTEIEGNDGINSMQELLNALNDGDEVEAEGEYYIENGDNIVIEVEFEVEENDDGDDEEFEFEGIVSSATSNSFILNGETFYVNNDTEFNGKDISSMQELLDALDDGDEVEAEGDYYIENGENIVVKVEFEVEENDDGDDDGDDEEFEFEGTVSSATSNSFILNGATYFVNEDTRFRGNDINSMQELLDALNEGDEVEAKGNYYIENGDNIVKGVKFDVEENDDNGDDGDDDDGDEEEFDFEGSVSSANSSSFVIDGETYVVTESSEIEGDGINSMQELIDALDNGDEVDAEGEYYVNESDENIVIEVEFEIEENDDDDDEDDDD